MSTDPSESDPDGRIDQAVSEARYRLSATENFLTDVASLGIDWSHVVQRPLHGSPLGPLRTEGPGFGHWAARARHELAGWEISLQESRTLWAGDRSVTPAVREACGFVTRQAEGWLARSRQWWWEVVEWGIRTDESCARRLQDFFDSRAGWQPLLSDLTSADDIWPVLEKIDGRLRADWRQCAGPVPQMSYRWLPGGRPFSRTVEDQIMRARRRLFDGLVLVSRAERRCLRLTMTTLDLLRAPGPNAARQGPGFAKLHGRLETAREEAFKAFGTLQDLDMCWSIALAFEEAHAFDCAFLEEGWERVLSDLEDMGRPQWREPSRRVQHKIGRLVARLGEDDGACRTKWLRAAGALEKFGNGVAGGASRRVPSPFQRWYLDFAVAQARKLPAHVFDVAPAGAGIGPVNLSPL